MKPLLAKSYKQKDYPKAAPDYALLTQHSRDVAQACRTLARTIGPAMLENAGLSQEWLPKFELTLVTNGWLQDLGKANSHFQEMVSGQSEMRQLLRHEVVSSILVYLVPEFHDWIFSQGNQDILDNQVMTIAVWGAIGHHRKFDEQSKEKQAPDLIVKMTHPDFRSILVEMAHDVGLTEPPNFSQDLRISRSKREGGHFGAHESLRCLQKMFETKEKEFASEEMRRFVALVKSLGTAADVAASAVAKKGESASEYSLAKFVEQELKNSLTTEDLTNLIYAWAWRRTNTPEVAWDLSKLPEGFQTRKFQEDVENCPSYLVLAQAGCGSGKSLAAYLWGRQWCIRFIEKGKPFRMFFCLPTTGTTTEHYRDYALESGIPTKLVKLAHSRSSIDLETIAKTSEQEEASDQGQESNSSQMAIEALNAEKDKIESLALWSTPLIVTTVDTVLGLMANARKSVFTLPAFANSAMVFDEIHAFDEELFGHLLVFLKNFPQIPTLLMTASLPIERRLAIEKIRPDLCLIPGPPTFEELERYRLQVANTEEQIWLAIDECVRAGGKVLWIRNRVEWANEKFCMASRDYPDIFVSVYHSRFCYKHRSKRHRKVIDAFKAADGAAILVATQVAEMSLDLSADLLISDIAPIPSLIQRMGRLNRKSTPENPTTPKMALIKAVPERESKPYEKDELDQAWQWIHNLSHLNRALSQKDLSEYFGNLVSSEKKEFSYAKAEELACFFGKPGKSGLWRTRPGLTRAEGHTISVILRQDYDRCDAWEYGKPTANWLREHEVSIPIRKEIIGWDRAANIPIAPKEQIKYDYDEETDKGTGAKWLES
jgi:CRISPR-associated endonuclease/helicase Cas3